MTQKPNVSHWKSPERPQMKKPRQLTFKTKFMLIRFFNVRGMDHFKSLFQAQIFDNHVYRDPAMLALLSQEKKARLVGKQLVSISQT